MFLRTNQVALRPSGNVVKVYAQELETEQPFRISFAR